MLDASRAARCAVPVQRDLVALDAKARRSEPLEVTRAPPGVIDPATFETLEMVVVMGRGHFVARPLSRKVHRMYDASLSEPFQIAIYGREADGTDNLPRSLQNLGGRERPPRGLEDRLDCVALPCCPIHRVLRSPCSPRLCHV
jgi:hypothetical protein